jgi:hypothetical protein
VTEITDGSGTLVEQYSYDVYGKPTIRDGSTNVLSASAIGNRLMFNSRDRDPDTLLYNYRYRYNSPIDIIDPFGLDAVSGWLSFVNNPRNPIPFTNPDWHKYRNTFNKCPKNEPKSGVDSKGIRWEQDRHPGGHGGTVYRSPTGSECVYDKCGKLLPDNGTFNYGPRKWSLKHIRLDFLAHYYFDSRYAPGLTQVYE